MDYSNAIERIYDHLENDQVEKAVLLCLRVARNLQDHLNAMIFLRDLNPDKQQLMRAFREDTAKLNDQAAEYVWKRAGELWLQSRVLGFTFDGKDDVEDGEKRDVLTVGVSEIDAEIEQMEKCINDLTLPAGMEPFDLAAFTDRYNNQKTGYRLRIKANRLIRGRIKTRCLNYAVSLERQLEGQKKTDQFLHGIQTEVNNYFRIRCEDVYVKIQKASQLVASNDPEDQSLLLTEVRRSIKAVADYFYPAVREPVMCSDGKQRNLDDEKYLNRLEEYVAKEFPKGSSSELLEAEVKVLTAFVRRLNDISSKGVHANVPTDEAKQGLLGLYMFLYNLIAKLQLKAPPEKSVSNG